MIGSHGGPNTPQKDANPNIVNVDVTNIINKGGGNHGAIDETSLKAVDRTIGETVDRNKKTD